MDKMAFHLVNLDFNISLAKKLCGCCMQGSFGEIRKAFWRGTPVAVKRVLPSLSDDQLIM